MADERWIDLLDPDERTLRERAPGSLHPTALERLLGRAEHDDEPRPVLEPHGDYVFGVLLVPVLVPEEDRVFYQEIDLVLTADSMLTVRKTPPSGEPPFDVEEARASCHPHEPIGTLAFHLVDTVAEGFLDLVDALNDEIDELEDHVEDWPAERIRSRISELRHGMLHIRGTLGPTRDAVRGIVDDRVELDADRGELFPREVELHFADAYDKLLRATEGLDLSRDLLGGVRDYHQAKIANDQNEVMKRLAAIASILLVPTFIVGLYGQNFRNIPELRWVWGYGWSWGLIVVTTAFQIWYFRRKRWL